MKIGICAPFAQVNDLLALGFDYVEGSLTELADMPREDYEKLLADNVRVYACNGMIPPRYRLTGPQADLAAAEEYCRLAAERAGALGAKVIVFGSGGARQLPEGTSQEEGYEQLRQYLAMAAPIFAEKGMRIAIEPLCTKECNIINSVSDGLRLAEMTGSENVGVLADLYHMDAGSEGNEGVLKAGKRLWHCHIANSNGRVYPYPGDGQQEHYAEFFAALDSFGYEGGVSIEAACKDRLAQGAAALAYLKEIAER